MVNNYLHNVDEQRKEQRRKLMFDMWMACNTNAVIAQQVDLSEKHVGRLVPDILDKCLKRQKLSAQHETDFKVPLYTVWAVNTRSAASAWLLPTARP